MKRMRIIFRLLTAAALFFLFLPLNAGAKDFAYQYRVGEKYKILSKVDEKVYINGMYSHQADILNRISVEISDYEDGTGTLEGKFITTEKLKGSTSAYKIENTYRSLYRRGPKGKYDIGQEYFMPVVRNVPVFPDRDVEVGDSWKKRGEEVHDFRRGYGIKEPYRIPFVANYRYLGREKLDGREFDLISVQYTVRHRTSAYYRKYPLYPERISGFSDQTIYWDDEKGRPYAYHEQFSMFFVMSNGDDYEFTGNAWARVTESVPMDKEKMVEDINRSIEEDDVRDTRARVDEEGVTIELENIKFDPDSARLQEEEKDKLDRISGILKKYPDRHLRITGHTAMAGSREGRQRLSELRARRVTEYLIEKGVRQPEEIIIEGKGAREPIADNDTVEGMRKNRRVEITILEN